LWSYEEEELWVEMSAVTSAQTVHGITRMPQRSTQLTQLSDTRPDASFELL